MDESVTHVKKLVSKTSSSSNAKRFATG